MGDHTPQRPGRQTLPSGEQLKADGVRRATATKRVAVLSLQVRLLTFILANGKGTVDDVSSDDEFAVRFGHRGWRGAAVAGLVARKLITCCGRRKTRRRFRHGGENRVWKARRPARLAAVIEGMKAELAHLASETEVSR